MNDIILSDYINETANYIDISRRPSWKEKIVYWHTNFGTVGLEEIKVFLEMLNGYDDFRTIYKYCKTINNDNMLLEMILELCSHHYSRAIDFKEYFSEKNKQRSKINSELDLSNRKAQIRDAVYFAMERLDIGVRFDDILAFFEVSPWDFEKIIKPVLDIVALTTVGGEIFKSYCLNNYREDLKKDNLVHAEGKCLGKDLVVLSKLINKNLIQ